MSKKLLLADDSITIQKVIQITFAHEDYELTITDNGDAAFAKAQEIRPDLVMADVYMPGKNGYELTTAMKQDPTLKNVPVLLLAGSFEPFDEDRAISCQANAWIEKPFESQNLIDKVAELLSAASVDTAAVAPSVAVPVAEAAPAPVAEAVQEETPAAAVEAPAVAEPQVAAPMEDPFGDISFEEEPPVAEPEPETFTPADDWSDVAAEPEIETPAATVEEPPAAVADDFTFADAEPVDADEDVFAAETPVVEEPEDVFAMGDDEIMPLGDDDILDAEDLEPVPEEQTLASWSRDSADEVFADAAADAEGTAETVFEAPEDTILAEEPIFAEEEPVFTDEAAAMPAVGEPVFEETIDFAEPEMVEAPEVEAPIAEQLPETALVDVEARAAALSEEDLEQIIEKVVAGVVEKLAGTILERVAWEVVPDLAEHMIREEIRKIKDAAA